MKTVPKVEDPVLQKFHYDQAQRMLLSTFIAEVSGNPGQQLRFQMPATVDEALQIAVTEFEAEAQEKRNLAFFFLNSETHRKSRGNFGQPWETFGRSEYGQAARVSVSKTPARLILAAKENCFVLSVRNGDILPENAFQINFLPERTKKKVGIPNHKKRESQAGLMLKLLVETPIVRKTCN
jgi:hypothetical protein